MSTAIPFVSGIRAIASIPRPEESQSATVRTPRFLVRSRPLDGIAR